MPEYLAELMMCDRGTLSGCCMRNISPAQRIFVTRAMDAGTPGSNPTILMGSSCKAAQGSTAGQGPHHFGVVCVDSVQVYCHRQSTDGGLRGLHWGSCG